MKYCPCLLIWWKHLITLWYFPWVISHLKKGDFVVDKESFQMIQNHMQRRAIDIVIDYEHQTLNGTQAQQVDG